MLRRLCGAALFHSLLVLSASAAAAPAAAEATAAKPTAAKPTAAKPTAAKPTELRRDPKGIKGISPFTEALMRGDTALLAHDLEGAIAAYRDAISRDAQNALGQYRLGEAQMIKGDLHEAEVAFSAGLRFVNAAGLGLKAKLQFALADLRERQKAYDEASTQWTAYETFTTAQKDAQGFPASGSERRRVVEAWKKLSADSLEVKARIEKGVKAADEAVRKSSK